EGERVGRHVLGDHRAGADVGARPHRDRRHQLGVRADEGALADVGVVFVEAVVVAEDRAGADVGAGTIFCNYDGFDKYDTHIGEGAFIGSDTELVAPVTVGPGAYVGSGSVITKDVPADALALARGRQVHKEGWAAEFRAMKLAEKAAKK